MALHYDLIHWTPFKKKYDMILMSLVITYVVFFTITNLLFHPSITVETIIIRCTGSLAFILLHLILSIGPLARLDARLLPLLYNRRHLGVTMFLIALVHAIFNLIQFHALGNINPFLSLFTSNTEFYSIAGFPFQLLGFLALMILALMAASSHDFWLKNLGPATWKKLHMMVYLAYVMIVMHVMLGTIQYEKSPLLYVLIIVGLMWLSILHLLAGFKNKVKNEIILPVKNDYLPVCKVSDIPVDRAKMINLNGQKIAVFRYENKINAVHNLCKHQHGPLSEGKIIDGCITCPWHGYQYLPHNGQSPAPFSEKVATYQVKIDGEMVLVDPIARPEGTECSPAIIRQN